MRCGDIPPHRTHGRVSCISLMVMGLMRRVNYLCTCIAINLMLIICFGVNPNGKSESFRLWRKAEVETNGQDWRGIMSADLSLWGSSYPSSLLHLGISDMMKCWILGTSSPRIDWYADSWYEVGLQLVRILTSSERRDWYGRIWFSTISLPHTRPGKCCCPDIEDEADR